MSKQCAVILDMDGTLADVSGIRHFVRPTAERKRKDFDAFHAESVNVPAHAHVVKIARDAHAAGIAVLIVTARRARWRNHSAMWLALNGVPSDALFMRADDDHRKDFDVKADILARIRQTWNPVLAVDDNPAVIALWEREGIPTHIVPGWED